MLRLSRVSGPKVPVGWSSECGSRTGWKTGGRGAYQDMARETYESKLKCPVCGREGLADVWDAKSYKMSDHDTRVDAVTEGFAIKNKREVVCSQCQVSAF